MDCIVCENFLYKIRGINFSLLNKQKVLIFFIKQLIITYGENTFIIYGEYFKNIYTVKYRCISLHIFNHLERYFSLYKETRLKQ